MREADWSKVLGWAGYRVYRHEIDEPGKRLKLWVRRKRGNRKLICSGCGRKLDDAYDIYEREVRDLPCFEFRTTVVVELYRMRCPDCGVKTEKVPQLPSKAPFSKRSRARQNICYGLRCGPRTTLSKFGGHDSNPSKQIFR